MPARLEKTVNDGKTWKAVTALAVSLGPAGYAVHFSGGAPDLGYGLGLLKTLNGARPSRRPGPGRRGWR